mmetsp:Transcript_38015/g.98143  ORF Transcript_38015/g.98143 Transcript_38015/m.98143 type:complete len:99 (+) Transcript_38015:94-390(+)|eukprot:CAMPEP_0113881088 /NCGR_PEP_ID=MMETSP0780_2-20120614/8166_1 /TAXON_ID=652834 /ORGANISM="Palpitomonas bilix" /LENGTH=98 /DNA_ID=CAMNT_0000867875 /DNA_START=46 /DNA_END=342 /DNA_ORIENTATION=- /assembly_acc=CAM_ASM_000599
MPQGGGKKLGLAKPKAKAAGSKLVRKSKKLTKKGRRFVAPKKVNEVDVLNKKYTGEVMRGIEERMANKVAQNHEKLGVLKDLVSEEAMEELKKKKPKK